MKILGIIAEYNPIHLGHLHQLRLAKKQTQCRHTIVAMSGNYMQRGEPALIDKWNRAKMAVASGADLVVEIPARYSLQSAEGFARAGVGLLESCGVTDLSFGSEAGDMVGLKTLAHWLMQPLTQQDIRRQIRRGISYAAAVERAARRSPAVSHLAPLLCGANNILAVEYLRALVGAPIVPHTVTRRDQFANASEIRRLFAAGRSVEALGHVPPPARGLLAQLESSMLFLDDFGPSLFYALTSMGTAGVAALPACSEGLENRLARGLGQARNLPELLTFIKTKRYPMVRIQRLLVQALLRFDTWKAPASIPYLRVLFASTAGKNLLSLLAKSKLPLLYSARDTSRLAPTAKRVLAEEIFGEKVYAMTQRLKGGRRI